MGYVDLHCHLDWESYGDEREKIILEMKEKNIIALSNTTSRKNFEESKKLFEKFDNVKVCPGLYPQDAEEITDKDFEDYLDLIRIEKDNILAIGEVGLDFHHTNKDDLNKVSLQENRFRAIIELGIELDKPLIIHTRKAEARVLEILREYIESTGFKKFDLHCFCGKKKLIKEIIELGVYCSIPLTILNTESFRILVKELPMKQILVETDSPFLHPEKIRNSPLTVPLIYEEIAKIKGYDKTEIVNMIHKNYMRFTM